MPSRRKTHSTSPRESGTGRFAKGSSGNPSGRPRGSKNQSTLLQEAISSDDEQALIRRIKDLALQGTPWALKLVAESLWPRPKDRPIQLDLPDIRTDRDLAVAHKKILRAVTNGQITIDQGQALGALINSRRRDLLLSRAAPKPKLDLDEDYFSEYVDKDFEDYGEVDEAQAPVGPVLPAVAEPQEIDPCQKSPKSDESPQES